ncbi:hypothetical protein Gogos_017903, partial [Gossypium gossypioides]|nr:hypothetical protein [Gossypium gossypioides]
VSYGDFAIDFNPIQLNNNLGRSTKKVRWWPTDLPDLENPIVDKNGVKVDGLKGAVQEEEFKLIDGDVMVEIVDGILLFTFLERVHKHIEKRMASLWKTKKLIQLIDLENDYYKVKFQDEEDYSAALIGEPWIIFGQYHMCLFKVIGEAIGSVYKIDHNTNSSTKGRFVRLTVCIDLGKPLVSKVKIDGKMQLEKEQFGPWMLVERKLRRRPQPTKSWGNGGVGGRNGGSHFKILGNNQMNNVVDGNPKFGKNIADSRGEILGIEIDSNVTKMGTNKGVSKKVILNSKGKGIVVPSGPKTTLYFKAIK